MDHEKKLQAYIYICTVLTAAILLFKFSFLAKTPPEATPYYVVVGVFYLLLLINLLLRQLRKNRRIKYASYFDHKNGMKKKLVMPGSTEIKEAFVTCCTTPRYILGGLALLCVFAVNYALIFYPGILSGLPRLLFDYDNSGSITKSNIWLALSSVSVLLLCLIIINQNHHIKANNRRAGRQNLIINAHSNIALANLRLIFMDINKMFLTANKLEYILNAKTPEGIRLPAGQALMHLRINLKLNSDYSVTEFYIRHLSILVDDLSLECYSYQTKFYQIFTVNNEFVLSFYIKLSDTDPKKLAQKFAAAESFSLYYNFIVKNSFSVVTDMYGSAQYEKSGEQSEDSLHYLTRDAKANQYYYI